MRPRCALTGSKRQRSGRDVRARATQARDRQPMSAILVESLTQPAAAHATGACERVSQRSGPLCVAMPDPRGAKR